VRAGRCRAPGLALLVACAAGCGSGGREEAALRTVALDSVEVIAGDVRLGEITDVAVAGHDTIWVLSKKAPVLTLLTGGAGSPKQFGRAGRGPGEIRNPWSLLRSSSRGAVGVWDVAAQEVLHYTPQGDLAGRVPVRLSGGVVRGDIRKVSYGHARRMRAVGDGFVLEDAPRGISRTRDYALMTLTLHDASGRPTDTIVDFSRGGSSPLPTASALVPIPLWTTCGDREVAVFDPGTATIRRYSSRGAVVDSQAVSVPRREVSSDDVFRYVLHVIRSESGPRNRPARELEDDASHVAWAARHEFGTVAPPAVDLLCSPGHAYLLQQFSTETDPLGFGREWILVRANSAPTVLRFPAGFQPVAFDGLQVIGILRAASRQQRIGRVRLPSAVLAGR
jgi:hypothetical protein